MQKQNRLYSKSHETFKAKGALYSQHRNSARWDCLSEEIPLIYQGPQVLEGIAGILEERMLRIHFGRVTISLSTRRSTVLGRGSFWQGGRLRWSVIWYQLGLSIIFGHICRSWLQLLASYFFVSHVLVSWNLDMTFKNYRPWVLHHLRESEKEVGLTVRGASLLPYTGGLCWGWESVAEQNLSYQALKMASSGLPSLSWQIFYTREGKSTKWSLRTLSKSLVTFLSKCHPWVWWRTKTSKG